MNGRKPDAVNLAFMIAMVESIRPRDAIEAMLVTQMVSVHVTAMRCAHHLACAEDLVQQENAGRALGRLARTFPAQIEALNRHRNHGAPVVTVQNVSVGDGGNAIVGNVTQHAGVIVSGRGRRAAEGAGLSNHPPRYRSDAGEPALRRQNPRRRIVPRADHARKAGLSNERWGDRIRRTEGKPERAPAGPVYGGDRRAQGDSGRAGSFGLHIGVAVSIAAISHRLKATIFLRSRCAVR